MTPTPPITLPLVDGVRVVVPDSLNLITPYVLCEQLDWFEDEIRFLRRLLKPGQHVIDIGANYGVYTLSMARAVGPEGRVWAFEPASTTAAFLEKSLAANGFGQVILEKAALSSAPGTARLSLNDNAELNELIRGDAAARASEEVPLTTLDACLERFGWRDIGVLKMDAEGEEANILKGGGHFFDTLSPLVLYEVKAGHQVHLELISAFAALGYASYRLVPGLGLLVPFGTGEAPDAYLLNLFCCKPDRARQLATEGLLLDALPAADAAPPAPATRHDWTESLAPLPFAGSLRDTWHPSMAGAQGPVLAQALALHAMSRDSSLAPAVRYQALDGALRQLRELCAGPSSVPRLLSLARVAREYGARQLAVQALEALANAILQTRSADASEPFLPPAARYEQLAPGAAIGNWLLGSILEELELLGSYSSFYTGNTARQRLEIACQLGFASDEIKRRLALVKQRFGG